MCELIAYKGSNCELPQHSPTREGYTGKDEKYEHPVKVEFVIGRVLRVTSEQAEGSSRFKCDTDVVVCIRFMCPITERRVYVKMPFDCKFVVTNGQLKLTATYATDEHYWTGHDESEFKLVLIYDKGEYCELAEPKWRIVLILPDDEEWTQ